MLAAAPSRTKIRASSLWMTSARSSGSGSAHIASTAPRCRFSIGTTRRRPTTRALPLYFATLIPLLLINIGSRELIPLLPLLPLLRSVLTRFVNLLCLWWKALDETQRLPPAERAAPSLLPPGLPRAIVARPLCYLYPRLHHSNVALRTCFLDDALAATLDAALAPTPSSPPSPPPRVDVIVLGAGFDSRSLRFARRYDTADVRWFEVDLPAVRSNDMIQLATPPTCQHANMPACQHANMPTCPHANMPTCQHANMPTCQHERISRRGYETDSSQGGDFSAAGDMSCPMVSFSFLLSGGISVGFAAAAAAAAALFAAWIRCCCSAHLRSPLVGCEAKRSEA